MGRGSPSAFVICGTLNMTIISLLQLFRVTLASSQPMIILTGYAGALVFVLTLLSITHLQIIFNADPVKWQVATVVSSLSLACLSCNLVHHVSIITCAIFSLVALYFIVKFYNFPSFAKKSHFICQHHHKTIKSD